MDIWLKQSTAVTLLIGPFIDDTDGKTAETGLTISQADVRLSKNGGDTAQKSDATSCTHDELGYYTCPLNTTDTNTLGLLKLMVHESGALPVWHTFTVVPAAVYDSLVLGTDYLPADAVQIEGADATDGINAACDTAISDASLATAANLATVDSVADAIKAKTDNLPASPAAVGSAMTLTSAYDFAKDDIETPLIMIGQQVAAVLEDTGTTLPASIAALPTDSDVQTAAAAALTAYDPPTKAELDSAVSPLATAAAVTTIDGLLDKLFDGTGVLSIKSLSIVNTTGDAVYIQGGPTGWGMYIEGGDDGLKVVGGVGSALKRHGIVAEGANTGSGLYLVKGETGYGLETDTIHIDGFDFDALPPVQVDYVGEDWVLGADDLKADVSGLATAAALATVDGIVDSILDDTGVVIPLIINGVATKVDVVDNFIDTEVAAIKNKTDQLVFTTPGKVDASATIDTSALATAAALATVDGIVDAILVDTGTAIPASIAALPTDADVQVAAAAALTAYDPPTKAELDSAVSPLATSAALATVDTVVDSILVDTGTTLPSELSAIEGKVDIVDTVVDSIKTLVQRVYRYFYNIREHTPNKTIVYADDGVTIDAEMSVGGDETSVIKGAAE